MSAALTPVHAVPLAHPPGLYPNNMCTHRGGAYASYAAESAVHTVQVATGAPCFRPLRFTEGRVHHLAAVNDAATQDVVLVVVLSARLVVLVVNGQQTHALSEPCGDAALTCAAAARVAGSEEMVVAVGASQGRLARCRLTSQGRRVEGAEEVTELAPAHGGRGITAIDLECITGGPATSVAMASGDAGGHVVLWTDGHPVQTVAPECDADAVTCVRLIASSNAVAVAYGGGQLRLIQRSSGAVAVTIQAHSRWIHTLVYSPARQWLATAAEDGQLYVWSVTAVDANRVCVAHGAVKDELPTGLAILEDERALLLTSYDVATLRTFAIPG
ncbi:WD domain, G-beta repeat [Novymonas esmeraldas]|uniref:WD domain, G-beta repeat n=1 Tax=Novymonas esmeraldas TaxID=1808958 RepID=A0AAW0F5H7_9TRYP